MALFALGAPNDSFIRHLINDLRRPRTMRPEDLCLPFDGRVLLLFDVLDLFHETGKFLKFSPGPIRHWARNWKVKLFDDVDELQLLVFLVLRITAEHVTDLLHSRGHCFRPGVLNVLHSGLERRLRRRVALCHLLDRLTYDASSRAARSGAGQPVGQRGDTLVSHSRHQALQLLTEPIQSKLASKGLTTAVIGRVGFSTAIARICGHINPSSALLVKHSVDAAEIGLLVLRAPRHRKYRPLARPDLRAARLLRPLVPRTRLRAARLLRPLVPRTRLRAARLLRPLVPRTRLRAARLLRPLVPRTRLRAARLLRPLVPRTRLRAARLLRPLVPRTRLRAARLLRPLVPRTRL